MLTKIVNTCQELLTSFAPAKNAQDYLDGRLSKSAQKQFSFGYFPSNEYLDMFVEQIGEKNLSNANIIFDKFIDGLMDRKYRYGTLENHNLILPYKDVYGRVVAIVGRSLLSDTERRDKKIAKYKNTSFAKGHHLFCLSDAKRYIIQKNLAIVVEGQFDAIKAFDVGIKNIVALGGSNMTFEQFALISRYTNNLLLLLDNDEAGKVGTERIIRLFGDRSNIKVGKLPDGYKDLDEFVGENGYVDLMTM